MTADHRREPVYRIGHGRQWHWAHVAEDGARLAVCSGQPVYVVGADPVAILPDERCGNHNCRKRWAEWSESARQRVEREGSRWATTAAT